MFIDTVKVNDTVAVARYGSWDIQNQGVYTVIKADKVKVVVKRICDGHERVFSRRTGCEKDYTGKFVEKNTFIESVEDQSERIAKRQQKQRIEGLWRNLEDVASKRNLADIKAAIAELEALL